MILSTDIGYTKFTNVFASFAAGAIQDFSSGVTTDTVLAQEWVIDGFSTLDNTVFSEFFAGGASSRAEIDGRERRATLNASTDRDRSIATSQAPWGSNNSSVSGLKRAGRPRWRFSRRCNQKI